MVCLSDGAERETRHVGEGESFPAGLMHVPGLGGDAENG